MTRQHPNTVSSALIPPKRFIRVAPLGIEYNNNLTCQGAIYKAVPHSHTVPMSVFSGSMPSPQSHIPRGTRNEQQLTRELLIVILNDFSARLLKVFGRPIQLVVHGGAVMVLHPTLAASTNRRTTRDIDFIKRSFLVEMHKSGIYDAEAKLQRCIDATAMKFQLGTDWFNADADIALPMAKTYASRPSQLYLLHCLSFCLVYYYQFSALLTDNLFLLPVRRVNTMILYIMTR